MTPILTEAELATIREHAQAEWPREACGLIVQRNQLRVVVRGRNVMDELHARDPERYPRTAEHAFALSDEQLALLEHHRREGWQLAVVYHSHTHREGANLSEEDVRGAFAGGTEPAYPDAAQVVISVAEFGPTEINGYRWDAARRKYVLAGCAVFERKLHGDTGVALEWRQPRVLPLVATTA